MSDPREAHAYVEKEFCQHEGGTGCPGTDGGAHCYAYLDSTDHRTCIDCGTPETPTREDQS